MNPWRDLRRLPREVWVLATATLVNRMGTMALPFLTLYLTRRLGFPDARAGGVLALYGLTALVVGPAAGRLCDRWSALRVVELSLVTSAAAMALFPLARSFEGVLAMTVLWSATAEAFRPASMTCMSEYAPPGLLKQAYALHRLAINLGMSVGPVVGGLLAADEPSALFWVDGASCALSAAVLRWAMSGRSPAARPQEGAAPSARALSDRRLLYALAGLLPVAVVFFQHESSMPLFLVRDLGFAESSYGFLFTINTALIILLEIPLNHATSAWSYRAALSLGSALYAVGFGALLFSSTPWHVAATVAVWTFGEMILFPGMSAYIAEISPPRRRGEYMGLYTMTFSLAFIIGSWAGVWALERLGGRNLWLATFLLGAASTCAFLGLPRRPPAEHG